MTQRRVRTPQGFGGCALRRRLRQCSLNKERLLCFLLQQNRSSTLNRTHPVGHLPPRYFGGASLAKAPKPSAASFYFGDIVVVRTPERFGDFGKTALNVRAAEEEVGGDVEKVAEADELLVVALKRPFLVALIDWLGDAEVSRDLRLRHPAGDAALLHSASDQSFQGHLDKIIRIMYDCNGDYTFYVYE